ncbi:hemocyanin G chain [Trichonephila inaurata madagascariensis]|uniref:Hemocyanin G chain n=1 Tax=Trichonephila inaurata madagascariensis TaxID=2747483 RepID=A0A8X6JM96_9ARAC|nr:hemocyanin G chain [Trichonephila inaurata madagascariensis]
MPLIKIGIFPSGYRYDCERLSNGLNRMVAFHNFEEKLEGYAPHLTSLVSGLHYAARPQGFSLRDLVDVDVQDMERWRERILEAIDLKHVHDAKGNQVPLDEVNGANILGSIIEANSDSPNKGFYGSLHNWGHVMMARMHDPDGRFQENPGLMSDTSTSLRDPIFYRWHRFVDNIFQQYKSTLQPYTWEQVHLDHEPFSITVNSENTQTRHSPGAPKYSEIDYFLMTSFHRIGQISLAIHFSFIGFRNPECGVTQLESPSSNKNGEKKKLVNLPKSRKERK